MKRRFKLSALVELGVGVAASAMLLLAGCGGGGGGGGGAAPLTLSGVAAKGPMNSATVTISVVNPDGSTGAVLGTGTTPADNSGKFFITLSSQPTGPVRVDVSGGSYISEFDGSPINTTTTMTAILASVPSGGLSNISVTPLTDMAASRAGNLIRAGQTPMNALTQADNEVKTAFGLGTNPENIAPSFSYASFQQGNTNAATLGQALITLETFARQTAATSAVMTSETVYSQMSLDFAADGKINGQGVNSNGAAATQQYGAINATSLPAVISQDAKISGTAFLNGVTPAALQTWVQASSVQASAAGVAATPATGYSCGVGLTLTTDNNGNQVCYDGTTTKSGSKLLGTYYACPNPADGNVASTAQCATQNYCNSAYVLTNDINGSKACWTGATISGNTWCTNGTVTTDINGNPVCQGGTTPPVGNGPNGLPIISTSANSYCPDATGNNLNVLLSGQSCPTQIPIPGQLNAFLPLTPQNALKKNSFIAATYTPPPTPPATAGTLKALAATDLAAVQAGSANSAAPSYEAPPAAGLNQAQIDAYANINSMIYSWFR